MLCFQANGRGGGRSRFRLQHVPLPATAIGVDFPVLTTPATAALVRFGAATRFVRIGNCRVIALMVFISIHFQYTRIRVASSSSTEDQRGRHHRHASISILTAAFTKSEACSNGSEQRDWGEKKKKKRVDTFSTDRFDIIKILKDTRRGRRSNTKRRCNTLSKGRR